MSTGTDTITVKTLNNIILLTQQLTSKCKSPTHSVVLPAWLLAVRWSRERGYCGEWQTCAIFFLLKALLFFVCISILHRFV